MRYFAEWIRDKGYEAYVNYRQALITASSKDISSEAANQVYEKAEWCWDASVRLRDMADFLDYQGYYPYHERYDFAQSQEAFDELTEEDFHNYAFGIKSWN